MGLKAYTVVVEITDQIEPLMALLRAIQSQGFGSFHGLVIATRPLRVKAGAHLNQGTMLVNLTTEGRLTDPDNRLYPYIENLDVLALEELDTEVVEAPEDEMRGQWKLEGPDMSFEDFYRRYGRGHRIAGTQDLTPARFDPDHHALGFTDAELAFFITAWDDQDKPRL